MKTYKRNIKEGYTGSQFHSRSVGFFGDRNKKDGVSESTLNISLFILILFFQGLAIVNIAYGQSRTMDPVLINMVEDAMMEMNAGDYSGAMEKLITVNGHSPSPSLEHLIGVCQFYSGKSIDDAIESLESATEFLIEENESWDPFCDKAPIHALNYLGKCYFNVGEFDKASEAFARFLVSLYVANTPDEWLISQTEKALVICEDMKILAFR